MTTSESCASVSPASIARLTWKGICSAWPLAIRAATVTRLRSRGASAGAPPEIAEQDLVRESASGGATAPADSCTAARRRASAASSRGSGSPARASSAAAMPRPSKTAFVSWTAEMATGQPA